MAQLLSFKVFPAHAGVILSVEIWYQINLCFSRTRGGDPSSGVFEMSPGTFFPHTRGWSRYWLATFCRIGVFPALAGVILPRTFQALLSWRFSRTRGGDPAGASSWLAQEAFFPHTRGIDKKRGKIFYEKEVFPAHAGDWLHKMRYKKNISIENW